jgi:hypothetical protein
MIKLKQLLNESVSDKIHKLISDANKLEDLNNNPEDLFAKTNHKSLILNFLFDIKKALDSGDKKLIDRLNQSDLTGTPEQVWRRLNDPKHPVRNYLILPHHLREDTKKPTWCAVVLDKDVQQKLLEYFSNDIPSGWEKIAHHMTIDPFHPFDESNNDGQLPGNRVILTCTHIGKSDKAIAVKVTGYSGKTNNKFPHITLAIDRKNGAKPKHSNDITDWKELETKPKVSGIIKNI